MMSCMSFILQVEWIFFNLRISFSLISLFIDYDSDSCSTSTFLSVCIFFLSDLVICTTAFSLSFFELTCFPPLMETLLPKYSPFGSLQIFPRNLNSRLAVLSQHLLEVEPSLYDCLLSRLGRRDRFLAWWKRSLAELKRFVKEGYYSFEDFLEGASLSLGLAAYFLGLGKCFEGWGSFDATFLWRDFGVGLLGCLGFRRGCMEAFHPPSFVFILKLQGKGYVKAEMIEVDRGKEEGRRGGQVKQTIGQSPQMNIVML